MYKLCGVPKVASRVSDRPLEWPCRGFERTNGARGRTGARGSGRPREINRLALLESPRHDGLAFMLYRFLIRPLLYLLPAEPAHHLGLFGLRFAAWVPGGLWLLGMLFRFRDPLLGVEALGLRFPNPVGLAAGFDKDAKVHRPLEALGFGFVEVGTVTAHGQVGNPRPRLFRLPQDRALINRMGFNNDGSEVAAARLEATQGTREGVLGINIGKTKKASESEAIADYVLSTRRLAPFADYFVVNVSSPNTPGLRDLQAVERLRPLLVAVRETLDSSVQDRKVALLVKIAPDLADSDVDAVADLALDLGLDGIIATNTTISREGLASVASHVEGCGAGGLSGEPVARRSLEVLRRLYAKVGQDVVLVSVGGIGDTDEAWTRICAGATLVQFYTSFVSQGPSLPSRINRGIRDRLRASGHKSLQEAIGCDLRSGV